MAELHGRQVDASGRPVLPRAADGADSADDDATGDRPGGRAGDAERSRPGRGETTVRWDDLFDEDDPTPDSPRPESPRPDAARPPDIEPVGPGAGEGLPGEGVPGWEQAPGVPAGGIPGGREYEPPAERPPERPAPRQPHADAPRQAGEAPQHEQAGDQPPVPERSARPEVAPPEPARPESALPESAPREPGRPEPGGTGPAETPPGADRPRLGEYRTELVRRVQPVVERDVSLMAAELRRESGGPVDVSVRAATTESLAERVALVGRREGRTASGTDVPDALGARITVGDSGQLATLVDRVRQRYAGGPGGRILAMEERGASDPGEAGGGGQDPGSPHDVRVTIGTESSGSPYAFTLWLSSRDLPEPGGGPSTDTAGPHLGGAA